MNRLLILVKGEQMSHMDNIPLSPKQAQALSEIKQRLTEKFDIKTFVLYGSIARGHADEESDVDLLVVTSKPLTRFERHKITDIVFEVNLQYDTTFSTLVIDQKSWETGFITVLPIRDEIIRDGIQV